MEKVEKGTFATEIKRHLQMSNSAFLSMKMTLD